MKFSFNKTPSKPKPNNVFQRGPKHESPVSKTHQCPTGSPSYVSQDAQSVDESKINDENPIQNPCTIFEHHHSVAIEFAEKGMFPDASREFDMAIRFWCIHSEALQHRYPSHYETFQFPAINSCDASTHFLNLYDHNKQRNDRKTKKSLWKPPPLHQPECDKSIQSKVDNVDGDVNEDNVNEDDAEIIYFDDTDSEAEPQMDTEHTNETQQTEQDIVEWKSSVIKHREIGSTMFEYHGQVLLEMDQDFAAIKACQSAILLNDQRAINWLTLSRAEMNFGDPFQALKSISRAIALDYEDNDIIEHYSEVYAVCSKLKEMKVNGRMTDDVLTRRLVQKATASKGKTEENQCSDEVKAVKQRLQKRGSAKDHIGRIDRKTDSQKMVANYQQMVKMTK